MDHRPKFPNCIMTPEVIRRINSEQEEYDKDPEKYERKLREQKEREEREREEWN